MPGHFEKANIDRPEEWVRISEDEVKKAITDGFWIGQLKRHPGEEYALGFTVKYRWVRDPTQYKSKSSLRDGKPRRLLIVDEMDTEWHDAKYSKLLERIKKRKSDINFDHHISLYWDCAPPRSARTVSPERG